MRKNFLSAKLTAFVIMAAILFGCSGKTSNPEDLVEGAPSPDFSLTALDGATFLTADLHAEFLRPTRPGMLRAHGRVVHQTKRTVFCSAELHDAEGNHLASARCTQVVLPER